MKVLVTGGAGFIGAHLCDRLLSQGHDVCAIDNFETGTQANLAQALRHPSFTLITRDIRDSLPDMAVDRIYNLACPASPRHCRKDPVGTLRTSVVGTLNVLDLCRRTGARFLQASTSEVYGDPDVHPQHEDYVGAVNCTGPRACCDEGSRAAETACFDYARQFGVSVRVARLFDTYGPGMSIEGGRVVSNFIVQALRGEALTIYGSGRQTRSLCYVDDAVDGLIALMEAEGEVVGPVNLGNPVEQSVGDIGRIVIAMTGSSSVMAHQDLPIDDPRVSKPQIDKALKLLGWTPKVGLEEGLDRTIRWFRAELEVADATDPKRRPGQQVVAIIGGGPAGLTAAYSLQKHSRDHHVVVLEQSNQVGGIARTETYKGYRFDIGGHRFFSKVPSVTALWKEVLPEDFLRRPRLSRIFYRGRYYAYPLKLFNALSNLGVYESVRIMLSYFKWKLRPHADETNFEQWVTNRFGGRLFWHFFKSYTEKVWGLPCTTIRADWAAQRIKNLSLRKAVWNAISGANDTTSLIEEFDYPRLGPGMMWEAFQSRVEEAGGEVRMNSSVTRVLHGDNRVRAIEVVEGSGVDKISRLVTADHFISSMPISTLIEIMSPPAPKPIRDAARKLKYRDFLIVTLILEGRDLFPDNWIYIHSPEVKVGRIQNFRSWSEEMVPNPDRSSIGMEYFCDEGDALWNSDDADLIRQAGTELEYLGLSTAARVVDGTVIRQPKAYPVYDEDYQEALDMIRGWLAELPNLQVVGRNGMHRYNNQDHSMVTAMLAADNILGGDNDLWQVNVDKEYHEDVESAPDLGRGRRGVFARAA